MVPKLDKLSNIPRFIAGLALAAISCYFLVYIPSKKLIDSINRRHDMVIKREEERHSKSIVLQDISLR